MHVQFTYTPEDYLEANRAFLTQFAPLRERLLFRIWIPFGILVAVAGVNWLLTHRGWVYGSIVTALGLTSFIWGSVIWGSVKSWPSLSRRLMQEFRKTPLLQGRVEVEIGDRGLRFKMTVANSDLSWAAFTAFTETDNLFLLLGHPRLFYMLPKRAFQPAELDGFRRMLERNIPTVERPT